MRLLDTPAKSVDDFSSRMEMLFESTLEAYIKERALMMVVIRENANPPALANYVAQLSSFFEGAKTNGFVREALDTEMITGTMLDRITNQVQFAPWLLDTLGIDLTTDADYKKRWCRSNLDLLLHGILARP